MNKSNFALDIATSNALLTNIVLGNNKKNVTIAPKGVTFLPLFKAPSPLPNIPAPF